MYKHFGYIKVVSCFATGLQKVLKHIFLDIYRNNIKKKIVPFVIILKIKSVTKILFCLFPQIVMKE